MADMKINLMKICTHYVMLMRQGVVPMKNFYTKIYHTKVSLHENFQIYGIKFSRFENKSPAPYFHTFSLQMCSIMLKLHVYMALQCSTEKLNVIKCWRNFGSCRISDSTSIENAHKHQALRVLYPTWAEILATKWKNNLCPLTGSGFRSQYPH